MTILRVGAERDEENGLKKHPHSGHRHRPYFRRARPFPPARLQRLPVFLEEWSARVAGGKLAGDRRARPAGFSRQAVDRVEQLRKVTPSRTFTVISKALPGPQGGSDGPAGVELACTVEPAPGRHRKPHSLA
jgi:hypothetical protein